MDNVFDTTATVQVYRPRQRHARCTGIWHWKLHSCGFQVSACLVV